MLSRRDLLKSIALTAGCYMLPGMDNGWVYAAQNAADKRLIVILQRGAVDGLSVVIPYGEEAYYQNRPSIAIARPGQDKGVIDLDGFFGLHPALAGVMPIWQHKSLAFIHASGSPAETRSHFEAQDILETASLHDYNSPQGWLNSLVQQLPKNQSSVQALSMGDVLPKICMGQANIPTISPGLRGNKNNAPHPQADKAYTQLYQNNPELQSLYQEGMMAHDQMSTDLQDEMETSGKDAVKPDGFTIACKKLSTAIIHDPHIQVAFLDVGGWDTHVGQGNASGQLANRLQKLSEGLVALVAGLGESYLNTQIVMMSEFGRTVKENGNGGTDHGHGNVIWLMGGGVKGGKVYGQWPGLSPTQLHEGRDLAITTDFREVISTVLVKHLGINGTQLSQIIKNYQPDGSLNGIIG